MYHNHCEHVIENRTLSIHDPMNQTGDQDCFAFSLVVQIPVGISHVRSVVTVHLVYVVASLCMVMVKGLSDIVFCHTRQLQTFSISETKLCLPEAIEKGPLPRDTRLSLILGMLIRTTRLTVYQFLGKTML